jgi:hypothetical protein
MYNMRFEHTSICAPVTVLVVSVITVSQTRRRWEDLVNDFKVGSAKQKGKTSEGKTRSDIPPIRC